MKAMLKTVGVILAVVVVYNLIKSKVPAVGNFLP